MLEHSQILETLTQLLSKTISGGITDLIPPDNLLEGINRIDSKIDKREEIPIDLHKESVYHIFKTSTIKTALVNNTVLLTISFPTITKEIYVMYRTIPIPVQIYEETTIIRPESDLFLTNRELSRYVPISFFELKSCKPKNLKRIMCPHSALIHFSTKNICEIEILKKAEISTVPTICRTEKVPNKNYIINLNNNNTYFLALSTPLTMRLICDQNIQNIPFKERGVVQLTRDCTLSDDTVILESHNVNVINDKKVIVPNFVFNQNFSKINLTFADFRPLETIMIKDHNSDYEKLKTNLRELKFEENNVLLTERLTNIDYHNYTQTIILFICILIIISFVLFRMKMKLSKKSPANTTINIHGTDPVVEAKAVTETKQETKPKPEQEREHHNRLLDELMMKELRHFRTSVKEEN